MCRTGKSPGSSHRWLLPAVLVLTVAQAIAGPKVIFLDVGQGDCILVQCPTSSEYVLIDCGTAGTHQTKSRTIRKFLATQLIKTVVITHGDTDHYGIVSTMLKDKKLTPEKIIVGGLSQDYTFKHDTKNKEKSTDGNDFLERLKQFNASKRDDKKNEVSVLDSKAPPKTGAWFLPNHFREFVSDSIVSCSDRSKVSFQVLSANYAKSEASNSEHVNARSIVLKMDYRPLASSSSSPDRPLRIYFMGDAEESTENFIENYLLSAEAPKSDKPVAMELDNSKQIKTRRASETDFKKPESSRVRTKSPQPERAKKPEKAETLVPKDCRAPKPVTAKPVPDSPTGSEHVVLKVGHHGSENGTKEAWLGFIRHEKGRPDAALISAGGATPHGHPRCKVLQRLDSKGPCQNASQHILCYSGRNAGEFPYGLSPEAVETYSTHIADSTYIARKKGVHWVLDLETRQWKKSDSLDEVQKELVGPKGKQPAPK